MARRTVDVPHNCNGPECSKSSDSRTAYLHWFFLSRGTEVLWFCSLVCLRIWTGDRLLRERFQAN